MRRKTLPATQPTSTEIQPTAVIVQPMRVDGLKSTSQSIFELTIGFKGKERLGMMGNLENIAERSVRFFDLAADAIGALPQPEQRTGIYKVLHPFKVYLMEQGGAEIPVEPRPSAAHVLALMSQQLVSVYGPGSRDIEAHNMFRNVAEAIKAVRGVEWEVKKILRPIARGISENNPENAIKSANEVALGLLGRRE